MFDRILVTLGSSAYTWSTIPYVKHLAKTFGSELHLLGLSTEPQQVWDKSLMSYIDGISNSLQEENIPIKTSFVYGNPAVETVKYSDKNRITLIATTAGSYSEITSSILSNIAKRMGINLNTPVLMVPPSHSKETDLSEKVAFLKILVPLDCSQVGEAVLPYVEAIAKKINSLVTLLHVNTPPIRGVPVMHLEVIRISRAAGTSYINKINTHLQNQGITANFEVIDGIPVKVILKYASQHKFDLIAMGTGSSSGIQDWISGSVTQKVSERTTIPILSISYSITGAF